VNLFVSIVHCVQCAASFMRAVYLIGVNHKYQLGLNSIVPVDAKPEDFEEFRDLLRTTVVGQNIQGIGEEMSVGGLRRHFVQGDSVPFAFAAEVSLPHRYCDPDAETRQRLGIASAQDRETYWIQEIISFDRFPLLFILGADHMNSFQSLLTVSGFLPLVVARDWEPSSSPEAAT
jgi:hypothetical protein